MALDRDAFSFDDLSALEALAREAGALALRWYQPGEKTKARVDYKAGGSPVTEADFAVDAFLADRLFALFPGTGWLSEETADSHERLAKSCTFIVDPIDGTRAYAEGDPRWAVSIALVHEGRPIAGVIHAPALQETFSACAGRGARLNGVAIAVSPAGLAGAQIVAPKGLIDKLAPALAMQPMPRIPSLALRFADVAAGRYGAAIAAANAHDWDIAAADLILHEAGGTLADCNGCVPAYNRRELKHDVLLAAGTHTINALAAQMRILLAS